MSRSISEGRAEPGAPVPYVDRRAAVAAGLIVVLAALVLYLASNTERWNVYNHFVWQADAFLQGRAWIPYPVGPTGGLPGNDYFNDVYPLFDDTGRFSGRVLIPFPPLPALVLLPFVAVAGLATDQELVGIALAALGVGLAWWALGRLPIGPGVRALTTAFFATGTAWWWSAAVGSTWYFAHLVAVNLSLLAVGIALRADPRAAEADGWDEEAGDRGAPEAPDGWGQGAGDDAPTGPAPGRARGFLAETFPLDRAQVLAGLLLGIAATARLPLVFAAPFLMLVGGGGTWQRRTASAAAGAILPVAALLAYTWITTGVLLHPGYEYQYQLEAAGYPTLGYNPEWAVEDIRYIPQNLAIMFASLPELLPDVLPDTLGFGPVVELCTAPGAVRGLFDPGCPLAVPRDIGTSILLTSPAFLLAAFPMARRPWTRLVLGSVLATITIALFNLAHFSQGWVQWGYRFSNDFLPFLLPLVALGAAVGAGTVRAGRPRVLAVVLVAISAVVNLWGIVWGGVLGW